MQTPWHVWVVGLVSLIWNAGGAYDYVMTRTGNVAYLDQMPPEGLALLQSAPLWFDIGWALGVWGAVAGSLLLLLRRRQAGAAFAVSIAGLLMSAVYSYGLADPSALDLMGPGAALFSVAILIVLVLLWGYTRGLIARRILT